MAADKKEKTDKEKT